MSQGGTTQELNAANQDQENAEEQVPPEPVVDVNWERPAADEAQGQQNVGASSGWRSRRRQAGPGTEEEDPSLSDPWESGNQDQWDNFEKFMRYRERNGRYENSGKGKGKGGRFRGEDDLDDRTNAGPAPAWDGTTSFQDYLVRAKIWVSTTRAPSRTRGPLLLKALTDTPFDTFKYLAKDDRWLSSTDNAGSLLKLMDSKDYYGEEEREDMLSAFARLTFHLRRGRSLLAKFDSAERKVFH